MAVLTRKGLVNKSMFKTKERCTPILAVVMPGQELYLTKIQDCHRSSWRHSMFVHGQLSVR